MPALQIQRRDLQFIFRVRRCGFAAAAGTIPQSGQISEEKH
jgi:hypothetical protein